MAMKKHELSQSFHRHTIGAMISALKNLSTILAKVEKHAVKNKIEPAALLQARLFPDMYPLIQQLQYCCYLPVDFAQHFADGPASRVGYDEADFEMVQKSIKTTIAYLKSIDPERLAERADRKVPAFFDSAKGMSAEDYGASVTMPDFYFHATVAYAILRHNGVPLGKSDFLGALSLKPI
jgi:hypothetical protein